MGTASPEKSSTRGYVCLTILLCSLILTTLRAQEQANFTQFFVNPYLLNPSYAGFDGQPSVSLFYRNQWISIDGAPTTTTLSLHAPLNSRLSTGMSVTNDTKGFFNNSTMLFSLGYHLQIQEQAFIRFGLSAGGSWNTVDLKKFEVLNDPALTGMLEKNVSLAGNAGVSFHVKYFHFGIALPSVFSPSYVSEDAFRVREVKPFQALVFNAGNRFYFNDNKNIFEPYLVYRINTGLPAQFELAGVVHLNHVVWAGGSYKQNFGIAGLGGITIKNSLAIGASYTIKNKGINELNSPGFEISLNYLFGRIKKGIPVYSFVNSEKEKQKKPSRSTQDVLAERREAFEAAQQKKAEAQAKLKADQAEAKKNRELQAKVRQEEAAKKQLDNQAKLRQDADDKKRLADEAKIKKAEEEKIRRATLEEERSQRESLAKKKVRDEEDRNDTEASTREQPGAIVPEPGQRANSPVGDIPEAAQQAYEREQLARLQTHKENPDQVLAVAEAPATVRHEIVKRGQHAQELEVSEYVIVGAFRTIENANRFSEGLTSLNYNTKVGFLTAKDLWYVYLLKTTDKAKARMERDRVGKVFLLRDAWLLTVEP
jgi:type IX secretion system PorP/SprF family membrane protein